MLHCGTVKVLLLGLCTTTSSFAFTHSPSLVKSTPTFLPISKLKSTSADTDTDTGTVENKKEIREVDAIIIGAGIGGLSCAALCAKYGLETLCLEAHDVPGGCAHAFDRYSSASTSTSNSNNQKIPFQFDSGPSLLSGMSSMGTNPLRQVLDAVGVTDCIDWKNYDGWIVHDYADDTKFKLTTGNGGERENYVVILYYLFFTFCNEINIWERKLEFFYNSFHKNFFSICVYILYTQPI